MKEKKADLTLVSQPEDYFRELVTDALMGHKVSIQPETEYYLVNLLKQFMTTDRLYTRGADGHTREEPLALMVKEALEQPEPEHQKSLFRHVGDVSLYIAGFFHESLARKHVDVDYYIDMGETAYKQVAARVPEEVLRALYHELAHKFASCVEVLATVSDKTQSRSEKDLLRIYELWMRTRSDRAAKALHDAGILPNPTVKKSLH